MSKLFLSCDWGTSNFRLRLVSESPFQIIGEVSTEVGSKTMHLNFADQKRNNPNDPSERISFYLSYLKGEISNLSQMSKANLAGLPVIISGMASSSIGIIDIDYAGLPYHLSGKNASFRYFEKNERFEHDLLIVSGVKSGDDVMRGEETQVIGLAESFGLENAVYILPGTHSKHILIKAASIIDFRTYMTGELFELLLNNSILKNSLEKGPFFGTRLSKWFVEGVLESGRSEGLLHQLFTVRTNDLFKKNSKGENFYFLSGLLIGTELNELKNYSGNKMVLCAQSSHAPLYKTALEALFGGDVCKQVTPQVVDTSAIIGQIKIFNELVKK